jgi:sugar lactone lactonase YvrE
LRLPTIDWGNNLKNQHIKASLLYTSNCILGEGAYWHEKRQSFFWVDIEGRKVFEINWISKQISKWDVPGRVSLVMEGTKQKMLIALQGGLAWLNLTNGDVDWLMDLEQSIPDNRTNDGACDAKGRLWLGTMELTCKKEAGHLYCIDKKLQPQPKINKVSISNGIAWTADNKKMYHTDTATGLIKEYNYDLNSGIIHFEKIAISVPQEMGAPDGICIDEEGMLWVAHWGGFGVYRWNPHTGELIEKIELSVPQVTSCAFGGSNMQYLFITTAKDGLSEEDFKKYPGSGNVYIAKPGAKGSVKHAFPYIKPPQLKEEGGFK